MGIATKQLEAIFKEINERFRRNRYVSIKPAEGDPPERYEVTYKIKGLHQNKNKEVHDATHHSISITIPFGFPHFPPNCKPLSPIFHPDFDQAAICIGDFWNKESSIPDLIIHIGHMIAGEVFSTDNAFNEAAVIWYRQHRDRIPFEILDFSMESPSVAGPASQAGSITDLETLEIDTIEVSDFATDFDFLNLEKQTKPQKTPQPLEIDVDLLQLMVKQRRFYTLYKHLQAIPADKQFKGFDELRDTAHLELEKAKQLLEQGLDCEHKGQPGLALEKFNQLTRTVTDYPEIEENINRAQRASELLYDFTEESEIELEPVPSRQEHESLPVDLPKKEKVTFFNERPKIRIPVLPLVILGASALFLGTVLLIISSINSEFKQAEKSYSDCQVSLEKNNFKAAEQSCSEALTIVNGIQFLKKQERISLIDNIQKTLNSQKLRQGLAGMVLMNGQYVPKTTKEALIVFNKLSSEGDTFMANLSWGQAENSYQQALNLAVKISIIERASVEKVRKNLALVQVNLFINDGRKMQESGEYDKAVIAFEKALEIAKSLDDAILTSTTKTLEPLLPVTRFLAAKKAGDTFFAGANWQEAIDNYQKAIEYFKNIQNPPIAEVSVLYENKTKAELYATIKSGKDAFDNAQWDEAIRRYDAAIKLLKENSAILSQVTTEENRQKLSRIMLQAAIIRDKQDVARKLKEGKNTQAIDKLQSIIDTITKSPFGKEDDYQQIAQEARLSIVETKSNQLISESVTYLTQNYKDIFSKNYSAATPESLSEPKATFVKKLGERLIFKLECNETGQGKPLRLVMNYIYDPATKQWQFYGENN